MVLTMIVYIFCLKFSYKDLLTSVKFHVAESAIAFSRLRYSHQYFPWVPQNIHKFTKRCTASAIMSVSDNNTHNNSNIGQCDMDLKYYENDKSSCFYETLCKFNILRNRHLFDSFAIHIYYHRSYTIYPTGKSDKNHDEKEDQNKYLLNEEWSTWEISWNFNYTNYYPSASLTCLFERMMQCLWNWADFYSYSHFEKRTIKKICK